MPVHLFRLAGIYGPGRSAIDAVRSGTARRIDKPGQVFSRIHVEDIARVLRASIDRVRIPAPPITCATTTRLRATKSRPMPANLLGVEPPPLVPFEQADLSPDGGQLLCRQQEGPQRPHQIRTGCDLEIPRLPAWRLRDLLEREGGRCPL